MTIDQKAEKHIIVLPSNCDTKVEVFSLPHPSNNASKSPVRVFLANDQAYQLKRHTFSKGCDHSKAKDMATDKYHYTQDLKPLKSSFLVNESQRDDGFLMERSDFEFSAKYDLAFNLCGAYYQKNVTQNESEYICNAGSGGDTITADKNFLTVRDYHDALIDNHDRNWAFVPLGVFEKALAQISESIVEAGDVYHKVTKLKITKWLVDKVLRIIDNFPEHTFTKNLPEDIIPKAKTVFACNLLISLIPQVAYFSLVQYTGDDLNVAQAFEVYHSYLDSTLKREKEQEILVNAAMSVGLGDGSRKKLQTKKVVKISKVQKVVTGKGAIDGFFRRKK